MVSLEVVAILLSGISISASLVYYANVLANANKTQQQALETRQAQFLMNILNTLRSVEFRNQWHLLERLEWTDFNDFLEKYDNDVESISAWTSIMMFFDGIGVMVENGLIDIDMVYPLIGGSVRMTWERFEPLILGDREYLKSYTNAWEHFEYLYNEVKQYEKKQKQI